MVLQIVLRRGRESVEEKSESRGIIQFACWSCGVCFGIDVDVDVVDSDVVVETT